METAFQQSRNNCYDRNYHRFNVIVCNSLCLYLLSLLNLKTVGCIDLFRQTVIMFQ